MILHLLKQVTMNEKLNRMTCHAMARLFMACFESKQYLQNMTDPNRSILLIKTLVYHSYFLFPPKQWKMKDIVIVERIEVNIYILYLYNLYSIYTKNSYKHV